MRRLLNCLLYHQLSLRWGHLAHLLNLLTIECIVQVEEMSKGLRVGNEATVKQATRFARLGKEPAYKMNLTRQKW
ncbi:hypothetical protein V6N11_072054 [Hibiscus sabdariffa]|uniref:Uncharacterized protein n=1 Tax=Hibiscus sabdariffa TaxID=183260 RepID=A0ABR2U1Y8_9ROSI